MTSKETARINALIAKHADIIERCSRDLAMNFNTPAQRIINHACTQMGIARIDWEKITAVQNGWEFEPPPAEMLRRWEQY
jgi:hypothetical protein